MSPQIFYYGASQTDGDIGPAHARGHFPVQLILVPVLNILEVHHPGIIVILTRKYNLVEVCRVNIGDGVLVGVPTPKAQIETPHEGDFTVNQT